jgi:hypothetical protein
VTVTQGGRVTEERESDAGGGVRQRRRRGRVTEEEEEEEEEEGVDRGVRHCQRRAECDSDTGEGE